MEKSIKKLEQKKKSGACRRAGIKDLRFHDLRHTFASRLIKRGADLIIVKELMGYASVRTTERYLHSQAKEKREAVETLAGQTQKYGLEWQKSGKSEQVEASADVVTPLFLDN